MEASRLGRTAAAEMIMRMVAPEGPVYQAGTLSGNPVAMAAGLATLSHLDGSRSYGRLDSTSASLELGLLEEAERAGVQVTTNRVGSMLGLFFSARGRSRTSRRRSAPTGASTPSSTARCSKRESTSRPPPSRPSSSPPPTPRRTSTRRSRRAGRAFAKCAAGALNYELDLPRRVQREGACPHAGLVHEAGGKIPPELQGGQREQAGHRDCEGPGARLRGGRRRRQGALGVDAGIIFADIMLPLEGMGVEFKIEENVGPIVSNPIRTLDDVNSLEP